MHRVDVNYLDSGVYGRGVCVRWGWVEAVGVIDGPEHCVHGASSYWAPCDFLDSPFMGRWGRVVVILYAPFFALGGVYQAWWKLFLWVGKLCVGEVSNLWLSHLAFPGSRSGIMELCFGYLSSRLDGYAADSLVHIGQEGFGLPVQAFFVLL